MVQMNILYGYKESAGYRERLNLDDCNAAYVARTLFIISLPADGAGELFKPLKQAQSLLGSILKITELSGLNFYDVTTEGDQVVFV